MSDQDRSAPPRAPGFRLILWPTVQVDITANEAADVEAFKAQRKAAIGVVAKERRAMLDDLEAKGLRKPGGSQ